MKKYYIVIAVLCLSLIASFACAESQDEEYKTFKLPSNLKIVDDEAFSGTAADTVILQDEVEYIGENAFSGMTTLSEIYIPQSTVYIAPNALLNTEVTIHGIKGSYADHWAEENGFKFVHEDIWLHIGQTFDFKKLRPVYYLISTIMQLAILTFYLAKGQHTWNRKRVKDHPELHELDLIFP